MAKAYVCDHCGILIKDVKEIYTDIDFRADGKIRSKTRFILHERSAKPYGNYQNITSMDNAEVCLDCQLIGAKALVAEVETLIKKRDK